MKYSIVTPNYNGFLLMNRYFESLENQTFKDFEVIVVDDCSTDDSFERLKAYAITSPLKLTVLQTEKNAGPGNARNIGMDAAQGKWVTFIDNDDWVDTTMLEKIEQILCGNSVDCVIFDYYTKSDEDQSISVSMYRGEEGITTMSKCMIYTRNHTFGKIYNLSKCREANIHYPLVRRCEDVAFVCRAIDACGSAYYHKDPLYYYYQRKSSLSNNKKMDEGDMVKAFAIVEETLGNKYLQEIKEKSVTDLLYGGILMMCKAGKSNREIKEYIRKYEIKYPSWYRCEIVHSIGKAKMAFLKCIQYKMVTLLKLLSYLHSKIVTG